MDCQHIHELLSEYIDNQLEKSIKDELEKHLAECNQCRRELEETRAAISFIKDNYQVEVPKNFRNALMSHINSGPKQKKSYRSRLINSVQRHRMAWATSLTAVATIIVVMIFGAGIYYKNFDSGNHSFGDLNPVASRESLYGSKEATKAKSSEQKSLVAGSGAPAQYDAGTRDKVEDRKVIKNEEINLEVKDYSAAENNLLQAVEKYTGFIENSNKDTRGAKRGLYVIRVPEDKLKSLSDDVEKLGRVTNMQVNGQDITEEFRDNEARLVALQKQEERLIGLLSKAQNLQDMLALEREMERLRQDIEMLQGRLKHMDSQATMATLRINVVEVNDQTRLETGGWKGLLNQVNNAFVKSINGILFFIKEVLIFAGGALPFLVLAAIALLLGRYIYKKKKGL